MLQHESGWAKYHHLGSLIGHLKAATCMHFLLKLKFYFTTPNAIYDKNNSQHRNLHLIFMLRLERFQSVLKTYSSLSDVLASTQGCVY